MDWMGEYTLPLQTAAPHDFSAPRRGVVYQTIPNCLVKKFSGQKMAADLYDADLSPARRVKAREKTRGVKGGAARTGISTRGADRRCSGAPVRIESPFCFLFLFFFFFFFFFFTREKKPGRGGELTAWTRPALIVNERARTNLEWTRNERRRGALTIESGNWYRRIDDYNNRLRCNRCTGGIAFCVARIKYFMRRTEIKSSWTRV